MEIETALRRHLLGLQTVNGYAAGRVFKHTLVVSPEGTGGYALVVRRLRGWASPDTVQSSEFPRVVVECWADPDRDDDGMRLSENGHDKAWALFRAVDRELHRKRDVWWGAGGVEPGLRIVTCVRSEEPIALGGPNAEAEGRPAIFGEMSMVPAIYNVHTVH